jgi:hypothetical protein
MLPDAALAALRRYPLLDALRERRSRRFGLGRVMDAGPLPYQPTALAATQRGHLARWHGGTPNGDPARCVEGS